MKDIDFDELDKAVSSALGKKQDKTVASEPDNNTQEAPDQEPIVEAPQAIDDSQVSDSVEPADTAETATEQVSVEPATPIAPVEKPAELAMPAPSQSPALKRSSGRFMDVVHPSSDMKSNVGQNRIQAQPRRLNLQPSSAATIGTDIAPAPSDGETNRDTEASSGSPFIKTDVEKRPLNASVNENVSENQFDEAPQPAPEVEENLMPDMNDIQPEAEPEVAMVPELGSDIVAIESAEATSGETSETADNEGLAEAGAPQEPSPILETHVEQKDAAEQEQEAQLPSEPQPVEAPSDAAESSVFTTSIAQQYSSAESKSDAAEHNIFDTQLYHQPLVAAHSGAGQKSHLVLYIIGFFILFLAVGAALGYFVFTYVS